jgi:hypothetical protein
MVVTFTVKLTCKISLKDNVIEYKVEEALVVGNILLK